MTHILLHRTRKPLFTSLCLPLLHASLESQGADAAAQGLLALYRRFGKLSENELTREMAGQLLEPAWGKVINSARRQQGLFLLHRVLAGAGS